MISLANSIARLSWKKRNLDYFNNTKKYTNKLLSQEIRFKNNNGYNYPNWNEEKLGNLIDEVNEKLF